jgi:hypothetical protein
VGLEKMFIGFSTGEAARILCKLLLFWVAI